MKFNCPTCRGYRTVEPGDGTPADRCWSCATRVESVCRTGCKTQDHDSYATCLRDANLQIGNLK